MNLIEHIRQYKYEVVNLGKNIKQKNFLRERFGGWYINSVKAEYYDGLMPENNIISGDDILTEFKFEKIFSDDEIKYIFEKTDQIFLSFAKKSKQFKLEDKNYTFLPNKINSHQEDRLNRLHKINNKDNKFTFEQDRNKLIALYDFI